MKRMLLKTLAAGALLMPGIAPAATPFPSQAIRLIVPWPAGGSADMIGRLLGEAMGRQLQTNVIVENVAGATGMIGTVQMVRSKPDGYTLALASSSANAAAPNLYRSIQFDPIKDFAPIGMVADVPSILIVKPDSPYRTPADVIKAAQRAPGKLSYGSGGVGNSGHLSGELFRSLGKISAVHVPYKGNNPALTDLMGGRLDYMFDNGAIPHIQSGRVRALAVAADKRLKALPEVPTFAELNMPGMKLSTWFALAAPAGTPPEVVARINQALNAALLEPALAQRLVDLGAAVEPTTPQAFTAFWREDLGRYKKLIEVSGAKLD